MQQMSDASAVADYGRGEPTFGGCRFDGDVVVAMFTRDLDRHARQLRPRLRAPDNFRVDLADRPYSEVAAANSRVQRRLLLGRARHEFVSGVGIAVDGGQFVVKVSVTDLTDDVAASVRAAAAPDEIVIVKAGLWTRA